MIEGVICTVGCCAPAGRLSLTRHDCAAAQSESGPSGFANLNDHEQANISNNSCWLLLVAIGLIVSSGCGLNTAVLQKGGNGRKGVLLNYSCGAHPCDPIDPSKPTIVMTHGWNPLPNRDSHDVRLQRERKALRCRCGDSYNLLELGLECGAGLAIQ